MAVVRLWLGGQNYHALQALPLRPRPETDPLGLGTQALGLLTEGIAVNSSANLEESPTAPGDSRPWLAEHMCSPETYTSVK